MPTASGLYYFSHGEDQINRPPVILIHGAGGTHLHWPPQIRRLVGQRIYAPDLPGHGKSEGIARQDTREYSGVLAEFMQALKIKKAIFVGLSMGSAIALQMALRYPKRVLGLGLLGSGAKLRVAPAVLESSANPSAFQSTVHMVVENSYSANVDPQVKALAVQRLEETRPSVLHSDFLACDSFDVMDKVAKISVPTLLICGAEDRMTPVRFSEYLRDQIPDARLEIIAGAGHMVMIEKPDETARLLETFLNSIQPE
ncbi:MAG: alpha/beta hydrolase [Anaerolineales bacterium]